MFKLYLMENFGYNEPIFLNDLSVEGLSENVIRQSLESLCSDGFLEKYDNGIYYIPKQDRLLGKSYLDPFLVILRKYVQNKSEIFGYMTGISFANQLGLTTQVPAVIEIVTNCEVTNGCMLMVGNQKVRVKQSVITIDNSNAELLQFLDAISQAEKNTELSMQETIDIFRSYIKQKDFTKAELLEVSSALTDEIEKKMIEWKLLYEFK